MSNGTINEALDVLCPMHLVLAPTGHILSVGPTMQKLRPRRTLEGCRFLEVFEVKRPRSITGVEGLRAAAGMKLHLKLRDAPQTELKGVLVEGPGEGEMIVNLSFGISIVDSVRDYRLSSADFAATDLAIEMLYLVEAKTAAMEASRQLNQRLQGARVAAEEQAYTDTLTGLKNRRAMDHVLARLIETGTQFALMHLDLDFFKAVNDTMGHAAGDHVLQQVAEVMVEETRDNDTVARVGGDEFVIIVKGVEDRMALARVGERIIDRLQKPIPFNGQVCQISASIGTALSGRYERPDAEQILEDADVALYASKHAGRACITFYEPALREVQAAPAPVVGEAQAPRAG